MKHQFAALPFSQMPGNDIFALSFDNNSGVRGRTGFRYVSTSYSHTKAVTASQGLRRSLNLIGLTDAMLKFSSLQNQFRAFLVSAEVYSLKMEPFTRRRRA